MHSRKHIIWIIVTIIVTIIVAFIGAFYAWYTIQLSPVSATKQQPEVVVIEPGSTPSDIAGTLEEKKLIRSSLAFLMYVQFHGYANTLQAGTYRLSPTESIPETVTHLANGKVDTFNITFLPGATLKENRDALIQAGYKADEVDHALSMQYNSPLFSDKPSHASLEGYIYGDTYSFTTGTSVQTILERTFKEFETVLKENKLQQAFYDQGLTVYEGITLASIIQREASVKGDDMPQIAQVFYSRLDQNMPLGSDVTYQYAADMLGVPRDPQLDSPYNTRRYTGLPPGPIATPGLDALRAVATPATGNYLYFLSGDDGITYFAYTITEHEANIANHCQIKCKIL